MASITKILLGSLAALLLCAGEVALLATDTSASGQQHSVTTR